MGEGLLLIMFFGFVILLVPICIGVLSGIPKLTIVIRLSENQEKTNVNKKFYGIITETAILTAIFFLSSKVPEKLLIQTIDYTSNLSANLAILFLKTYVLNHAFLAFLFVLILTLPVYFFLAKKIQHHFYGIELTKVGSILFNIAMPVVLSVLIIVFSFENKLANKHPRGFKSQNANFQNKLLIHSSYNGLPNLTERLIHMGADVNYDSGHGFTPLFASFASGILSFGDRYRTCKVLLSNGAFVDARDARGCPAVVLLARNGQIELAKLLIEYGADISAKDKFGKTYTDYCSKYAEE